MWIDVDEDYDANRVEEACGIIREMLEKRGFDIQNYEGYDTEIEDAVYDILYGFMKWALGKRIDVNEAGPLLKSVAQFLNELDETQDRMLFTSVLKSLMKSDLNVRWSFDSFSIDGYPKYKVTDIATYRIIWKKFFEEFLRYATIDSLAELKRGFKVNELGDREDEEWINRFEKRMQDDIGMFDFDLLLKATPKLFPLVSNTVFENIFNGTLDGKYSYNNIPKVVMKMAELTEYFGYSFVCCAKRYESIIRFIMLKKEDLCVQSDFCDVVDTLVRVFKVEREKIDNVTRDCALFMIYKMQETNSKEEFSMYRDRLCVLLADKNVFDIVDENNPHLIDQYK